MRGRRWVLNEKNIFKSIEDLQAHREIHNTSLGIIKPSSILGCGIVKKNSTEIRETELKKKSIMAQLDMLGEKTGS